MFKMFEGLNLYIMEEEEEEVYLIGFYFDFGFF